MNKPDLVYPKILAFYDERAKRIRAVKAELERLAFAEEQDSALKKLESDEFKNELGLEAAYQTMSEASVYFIGNIFQEVCLAKNRFPRWCDLQMPTSKCWFEGAPIRIPGIREPICAIMVEIFTENRALEITELAFQRYKTLYANKPLPPDNVLRESFKQVKDQAILDGELQEPAKLLIRVDAFFENKRGSEKSYPFYYILDVLAREEDSSKKFVGENIINSTDSSYTRPFALPLLMAAYNLICLITSVNVRLVLEKPKNSKGKRNRNKPQNANPPYRWVKLLLSKKQKVYEKSDATNKKFSYSYRHDVGESFKKYRRCKNCNAINSILRILRNDPCKKCASNIADTRVEVYYSQKYKRGPDVAQAAAKKIYDVKIGDLTVSQIISKIGLT